jgi:ATP-dependent DNA helicase DinG
MHQRAAEADLIIVNHHLFFADLALKQDDFGSVLPEYGAVIFDEAHEIEDVASDYFGRQISNYRFEELGRDAEIAARDHKGRRHGAAKANRADARELAQLFRGVSGARGPLPVRQGAARGIPGTKHGGLRRPGERA